MKGWILAAALLAGAPALADEDAAFTAQVRKFVQQHVDAFNAHDTAAVVALYAPEGVYVAPDGHIEHAQDRPEALKKYFAMGLTEEAAVTEAHRYGGGGFAFGTFSFQNADKAIVLRANWSAAYRIDGDRILIELLTGSVPPPPRKS